MKSDHCSMNRLRSYTIELLLIGTLLLSVLFFGYLGYGLLRPEVISETFSGEKALANAQKQVEFGPRVTGTERSTRMGDWLIDQLRLLGWDVVIQPFPVGNTITARNIIAVRSHSKAGAPVALLTTPYDTRLVADADPEPANQQSPPLGANTGASGTALLLELARTLNIEATGHTVCLAFFDAETNGGLPGWEANMGSRLFVDSLPDSVPRCASPRFAVDVNNVGAADQRFFRDESGDPQLQESIWRAADNLKWSTWFPDAERPLPPDSHTAFQQQGVPAAALIGYDYPYQNTLQDTLDKLKAETFQHAGVTLETWLEAGP